MPIAECLRGRRGPLAKGAKNAKGGVVVVMGAADHDHLGKAITYAAFLGTSAVVWIAPVFTEEHRKALDWLNDNSSEDVSFIGVTLELWQIDDSRLAVRFNVVSRAPDIIRKSAVRNVERQLTEGKALQLEWWTDFRNALQQSNVVPSVHSPRPQYWYNVALGRTGIHLSLTANVTDHKIGVRVYMRGKYNADAALSQLLEHKDEIETEIGETLLWNPNPSATDKVIAIYRDADLNRRDHWNEYCDWLVDMTRRFREAFSSKVRDLALDEIEGEEDPEVETQHQDALKS